MNIILNEICNDINEELTVKVYFMEDNYCDIFIWSDTFSLQYKTNNKVLIDMTMEYVDKIDLTNCNDINTIESILKSSYELDRINLSNCNINDEHLFYLNDINEIDLHNCKNITSEGINSIRNCNIIDISECDINEEDITLDAVIIS